MKLYELTTGTFADLKTCNFYYLVWNKIPDSYDIREVVSRTEPKIGICDPERDIAVQMPNGQFYGSADAARYAALSFVKEIDEEGLADLVSQNQKDILHF